MRPSLPSQRRSHRVPSALRFGSGVLFPILVAACLQPDQELPFELGEGTTATRTIGPNGGTVSLPSGVAVTIPPGALSVPTSITLTPRLDAAFPADAGRVVPGTAYDVGPSGVALRAAARLAIRLPAAGLPSEDALRLGAAYVAQGRAHLLGTGSYDATSRLLTASLPSLGPVAAVVSDDAVPVGTGTPPPLDGGSFAAGTSGAAALTGGTGGAEAMQPFSADCRPEGRRCFESGIVTMWASPELRQRLGGDMVLLAPRVRAEISFGGLDVNGHPTVALGALSVRGTLRVQLGRAVSSYEIDETFHTGTEALTAGTTSVRVQGNRIVLSRTSDGNDRVLEYTLTRIGTGRLLILRVEEDVELENDDGSKTTGRMILESRLRG